MNPPLPPVSCYHTEHSPGLTSLWSSPQFCLIICRPSSFDLETEIETEIGELHHICPPPSAPPLVFQQPASRSSCFDLVHNSMLHLTMHSHCALWSCAVTRVVLVYCGARISNFGEGPAPTPPGSLYFFSPTQINCLHLIKDASCRLSSTCLLSPAFSPFSLPSLSSLSFPPHVLILMSTITASHLLYRILETFCVV